MILRRALYFFSPFEDKELKALMTVPEVIDRPVAEHDPKLGSNVTETTWSSPILCCQKRELLSVSSS